MKRARMMMVVAACLAVAAGTVFAGSPAQAQFPGENGLIAFQIDTGSGNQIFTVEADGNDLFQVTHLHDASTPDWSPDGRWIAFSRNECSIALIHPDGTDLQKIPSQTPGGCETDPAFTPNGRRLVFERFDPATNDDAIWIMHVDGSDRRRLGTGPLGGAATPEVSPDGRTVSFLTGNKDDLTEIWAVSIRGGDSWQVTPALWGMTFKHDWAPDGSRIVVSDNAGNPDRPVNLLTIRPNGTGLLYLTDFQRPSRRALAGGYSPDGEWIVLRVEHGDQSALELIHPDGTDLHAILPFSDFRPRFIDWGPTPS